MPLGERVAELAADGFAVGRDDDQPQLAGRVTLCRVADDRPDDERRREDNDEEEYNYDCPNLRTIVLQESASDVPGIGIHE